MVIGNSIYCVLVFIIESRLADLFTQYNQYNKM